ncbi:DNA repair protein RadC [Comamonas sp. Y6]|uniref:DNA repair protein RadC n=1 Tax=Comamonas resistens TaxID=3046670 RepID=A0ABY8SQ51_9BURK|nr:DNA repair protein RadC [Comamonas resistens]MDL5035791.1 DNA repair protein RadC [Comamonas resistens]WHS65204.1 DNA repair protein RadC [Comamonas resistens]HBP0979009.1 DNA repair protein RadC [Pseudomonas aeruginosa]
MSSLVNDACTGCLSTITPQSDDWIIQKAIEVLEQRMFKAGPLLERPQAVKDYLRLKLVAEPNEVFAILFMNSQHEVLAYEPMFKGTIDSAGVHPRVVLQRALELNAAAAIFPHQHPSGKTEPSSADRQLTTHLKTALEFIDVRVLDHIIVGKGTPYSFAESGLL